MARGEIERPILNSLLDRLIDLDLENSREMPVTRAHSVRQYKASVRRDLEWLLNTRANPEHPGDHEEQLANSVFAFGLADITSLSADSPDDRARLIRMIETALLTFEPRFESVSVSEVQTQGGAHRQIRFQIQAVLRMDPAPEQVLFDTVLDLASHTYQVKGE
jgi:type VI secretion system protein ImpF